MKIWVISDTHFGHDKMIEWGSRKGGFEQSILGNLSDVLTENDIMLHLGDVCLGNDAHWNNLIANIVCRKKWLIKGNHDSKSSNWYLNHGWDFVGTKINLRQFGHTIVCSHTPQALSNSGRVNIHGHLHDDGHRKPEYMLQKWNILVTHKPQTLESIIKKWKANDD